MNGEMNESVIVTLFATVTTETKRAVKMDRGSAGSRPLTADVCDVTAR